MALPCLSEAFVTACVSAHLNVRLKRLKVGGVRAFVETFPSIIVVLEQLRCGK